MPQSRAVVALSPIVQNDNGTWSYYQLSPQGTLKRSYPFPVRRDAIVQRDGQTVAMRVAGIGVVVIRDDDSWASLRLMAALIKRTM